MPMTSADVTGAAAPDRSSPGPSPAALLAILGGLVLLVLGLTWPLLLLVGWITKGSLYFWVFLLGAALVALIGYARFMDERALRRVRGIRGPDAADEVALTRTFAEAGLPGVTVWRARIEPNTVQTFGAITLGGIRRHVVLPLAHESETPDPTIDAAGDERALAARARREFATVAPWRRTVSNAASAATLNPVTTARRLLRASPRRSADGTIPLPHVGPSRPIALLGALIIGYAVCVAASATRADGRVDSSDNPWATFAAYALFGAGFLIYLLVSPSRWPLIPVDGSTEDPDAPLWKGKLDPRRAERNDVVLQARRSYITVFGSFITWFAASLWLLKVPLGIAEASGWVQEATLAYQVCYVLAIVPALWIGAVALRTTWGMTKRPRPGIAITVWLLTYLAITLLVPVLLWLVLQTGVIDETSGLSVGITAGVIALLLTGGLIPLANHLIGRFTDGTDPLSQKVGGGIPQAPPVPDPELRTRQDSP